MINLDLCPKQTDDPLPVRSRHARITKIPWPGRMVVFFMYPVSQHVWAAGIGLDSKRALTPGPLRGNLALPLMLLRVCLDATAPMSRT